MMHHLWHMNVTQFEAFVQSNIIDPVDGVEGMFEDLYDGHAPPLKLWLNAPALMGEREEHDTLERAARYNAIARRMLSPKGWVEIDWFHMTMSRAYDSTKARDGMHHTPNIVRNLVQVIAHILCYDDDGKPIAMQRWKDIA